MNFSFYSLFSIAIAIFSMYFGAGNLIYPLMVGRDSAGMLLISFAGFLISGILIPVTGLVAMVLFDSDYIAFFQRLGKHVGNFSIFLCMLIIGPLIVMPRIVTLSHVMIAPLLSGSFLGNIDYFSAFIFALIFLTITFILTYSEKRIVDLLGIFVGPILLLALAIIIFKGIFYKTGTFVEPVIESKSSLKVFFRSLFLGYGTLDLLGSIFFSATIGVLLQKTYPMISLVQRAWYTILCGTVGVVLLGIVYFGLTVIGMYYGSEFILSGAGDLFRDISLRILGTEGSYVIAIAVCMACISTAMALSVSLAEYVQYISNDKISYENALLLVLVSSIPLSIAGLDTVHGIAAGPLLYIGYPTLIALTLCNILYKLFHFTFIKLPVFLVFFCAVAIYTVSYFFVIL